MVTKTFWTGLLGASLFVVGCGEETKPVDIANEALDTAEISRAEAAVIAPFALKLRLDADAKQLAMEAKDATLFEGDDGCDEAKLEDEIRVVVPLKNCQSPFGVAGLQGDVKVDYFAGNTDSVHLRVETDMKANGGELDFRNEVVGLAGTGGATTNFVIRTEGTSRGPLKNDVYRYGRSSVTALEADGCLQLDGHWTTRGDHHEEGSTTFLKGYRRCLDLCPAAGAEIVVQEKPSETLMTVTFDGSNVAQWVGKDESGQLQLDCRTE